MNRPSIISLVLLTAGSLLPACSSDGNNNNVIPAGPGIDCPGIDGVYYFATTATGACASQGISVNDRGLVVQDHAVMTSSMPACTSTVTHAGCTITVEANCALGIKVVATETFAPGSPNMVTGTQSQTSTSGSVCVYEIYGSTDMALVHQHAGIGDAGAGAVAALATPSTPTPSNLPAATAECEANAQAEEKACPRDAAVALEAAYCAKNWARYDAQGCGDAMRAFTNCRTTQVGSMDCATGENPACSIYQNAYFQCQSAFTLATGCVASANETACAGLGTYGYACLSGKAPAATCSAQPGPDSGSSVAAFCCY